MTVEEKIEKYWEEWPEKFIQGSDAKAFAAYCLAQREKETKWIPFKDNERMFEIMASRNCLCKFDDGTVVRYNDEHPIAEMTHFEYKP